MQKPFDASLARKSCHAFGRIDVHRLERVSASLYVQADSVYHGECTLDGCGDRLILIDIAMDRLELVAGIREKHNGSVWAPRGHGNVQTGRRSTSELVPSRRSRLTGSTRLPAV